MQIGWVDFSKTERDKVVSILRLLGTQTALDELGIGTVRDAFSDMLFPGISTLQTRAKYFVILPYLFAQAENHRFSLGRQDSFCDRTPESGARSQLRFFRSALPRRAGIRSKSFKS